MGLRLFKVFVGISVICGLITPLILCTFIVKKTYTNVCENPTDNIASFFMPAQARGIEYIKGLEKGKQIGRRAAIQYFAEQDTTKILTLDLKELLELENEYQNQYTNE